MNVIEETDDRFYIAESKLPNAGMGLFAKVKIEKGDYIEVIGVNVKYGGIADKCTHFANRYKFAAEPEKEFVHSLIPLGYAAMINQANTKEQQNVSLTHLPETVVCKFCAGQGGECPECGGGGYATLVPRNPAAGRTIYAALRDIEPDEEILGNYGKKVGQLVIEGQSFDDNDKKEWNRFLKHGLYGLEVLLDE